MTILPINCYCLFLESTIIVRKKSSQHGYDPIEYVYMRIQFVELKMPTFLPYLGKLESDNAEDVNYAATQLSDTDVAVLEKNIAPTAGEASAKRLQRFQLSPFTIAKLSDSAAFRLGSIFCDTNIQ